MNGSRLEILKNSILASLGLVCFGFCVYCVIQANIGVGPWDVFCIGLSNSLDVIYGTASIGISVVLIIIDLLMGEKIGIGTILDAVLVGKTVDFFNWINLIPAVENNLALSIALLIFAFVGEGFSQYFYMKAGLSCGPRDSLQIALGKRIPKLPIGVVNIFLLAIVLGIGVLLKGPVGIGTVLCPVGIGFSQDLVFKLMKFDPKTVEHQSLLASLNVLRKP